MVEPPNDRQVGARPAPELVGRADLVVRFGLVLGSGDHRLITLLGPGGVGKTSLARSLAATADRPVTFAELAAIDDDELILPVVAAALGIESIGAGGLLDAVATVLGAESPLLILDNLEQLPGAGRVIRALLEANPRLTILATSRTRLRVPDELVVEIEPLAVPDSAGGGQGVEALRGYAAIELFESWARQVLPEFELTNRNGRRVAEIVRRLDGLPLAIELVASRARSLSIPDMVTRLNELLPLPDRAERDVPDRQRTVFSSINWSYDLLPPAGRQALARLSVFPARFDLEAAEAVAGAGVAEIELLLDYFFLRLDRSDETWHRFDLPEAVRQFGRDQLRQNGEEYEIRRRHARWRADLGEWILTADFSPDWRESGKRYAATSDDAYQALEWSIAQREALLAARLYVGLAHHRASLPWSIVSVWRKQMHDLLEQYDLDPAIAAYAFTESGVAAYGAGQLELAASDLGRAIHLARQSENIDSLASAIMVSGAVLRGLARDDVDGLIGELQTLLPRVEQVRFQYAGYSELGAQAMIRGDLDLAWRHFQMAYDIARNSGIMIEAGNALHFIGYVALRRGEFDNARDAFRRSVTLQEGGPETQRLAALHGLGRTDLLSGRFADAYDALSQALYGRKRRGETHQVRIILMDMALLARASGRPRLAARWFGAIGLDSSLLAPKRFFADHWIEAVELTRLELGSEEYDRAIEYGRLIGLDEAVEAALALAAPTSAGFDANQANLAHLTPRELEVLRLIVEGSSDRQIAEALFISPLTATRHVKNILRKLDAPTRTAAAMLAVRRGIIRTDS